MDGFEGRVLLGHVTGVEGELIIPLHRVTPVLYPRVCVLCHLPAGYRFPTSSPTCCRIGGGMQCRITQCRHSHFEAHGHYGLDFSNWHQTILDMFQMEEGGKDMGKTF